MGFVPRETYEKPPKSGVPYLRHSWEKRSMKEQSIRTTVDIPASLYRKLKEQDAAQGRSIRELILLGVRVTLIEGQRPRSKRVKFPLIASDGPKVDLTNEQIYARRILIGEMSCGGEGGIETAIGEWEVTGR
jgi:hypothetical protein